jgi:hypothetical protein
VGTVVLATDFTIFSNFWALVGPFSATIAIRSSSETFEIACSSASPILKNLRHTEVEIEYGWKVVQRLEHGLFGCKDVLQPPAKKDCVDVGCPNPYSYNFWNCTEGVNV